MRTMMVPRPVRRLESMSMAKRFAQTSMSRKGAVLSEEEQAVENVYFKKVEQEKLEKLQKKYASSRSPESRAETEPQQKNGVQPVPGK